MTTRLLVSQVAATLTGLRVVWQNRYRQPERLSLFIEHSANLRMGRLGQPELFRYLCEYFVFSPVSIYGTLLMM